MEGRVYAEAKTAQSENDGSKGKIRKARSAAEDRRIKSPSEETVEKAQTLELDLDPDILQGLG